MKFEVGDLLVLYNNRDRSEVKSCGLIIKIDGSVFVVKWSDFPLLNGHYVPSSIWTYGDIMFAQKQGRLEVVKKKSK